MKTKVIAKAAAVVAVGWAMSATAPILAGTLIDQLTWSSLPKSFEAGNDPDDVIADRFFSITDDNLAIKFTLTNGAKPDNVETVITNSTGNEVLDTRSDTELLFLKLPEGNYTVESTWREKTITRDITLSPYSQSKLAINWDVD